MFRPSTLWHEFTLFPSSNCHKFPENEPRRATKCARKGRQAARGRSERAWTSWFHAQPGRAGFGSQDSPLHFPLCTVELETLSVLLPRHRPGTGTYMPAQACSCRIVTPSYLPTYIVPPSTRFEPGPTTSVIIAEAVTMEHIASGDFASSFEASKPCVRRELEWKSPKSHGFRGVAWRFGRRFALQQAL